MRLGLLENLPAMLNDFRELWGLIYQIIKLTQQEINIGYCGNTLFKYCNQWKYIQWNTNTG